MADILFANYAYSQLASGLTTGATTLSVTTTHGARFPSPTGAQYFYLVIENASLNYEIVKVTARAGDSMTIVRAQDNTAAQAWNAGDVVGLRMVAAALNDAIAAAEGDGVALLAGAAFTGNVSTTGTLTVAGTSTMTGAVAANGGVDVPAGQTGSKAPRASEVVGKTAATGSASLPVGTTAERDGTPAEGMLRGNSDTKEPEYYDGVSWRGLRERLRATLSTASGSALVEHTGVPAALDHIKLRFKNVSLTGSDHVLVQIGPTAAIATTGYTDCRAHAISSSTFATDTSTAGFLIRINSATRQISGMLELHRISGNEWSAVGHFTAADIILTCTGTKDLSADALARIGVVPISGSFDGGAVTVFY